MNTYIHPYNELTFIGIDCAERKVLCRSLAFGNDVKKRGFSENVDENKHIVIDQRKPVNFF